ncbi:unnamed protein product [Cylicostephanus goldi]|uniref:Uncharacterized protein n=1 Tax=Cylicostephanus goldi TaxID=71465 RepID=A0A3P6TP23_CYLGO|nr:unnamed protein product [Cylicostephanus goldi]
MEKARLSQPSQESRSSQRLTQEVGSQKMSQGSVSASQRSQPNTPIPQRQASDHNKVAGIMQTPSSRKAKDAGKSLNDLVGGESSPIQEDIPFSLSEDPDKEVFDPTAALNISANSNDPGADFLSLMETTNEKKAKSGRNRASPDGDFSFSIFGAAAEGGATSSGSGDGEFAFDFGNPTQDGDGADDGGFQFNFGGSEEQGNDKDEGFNLFGF